jgi:hypothetical protein
MIACLTPKFKGGKGKRDKRKVNIRLILRLAKKKGGFFEVGFWGNQQLPLGFSGLIGLVAPIGNSIPDKRRKNSFLLPKYQ